MRPAAWIIGAQLLDLLDGDAGHDLVVGVHHRFDDDRVAGIDAQHRGWALSTSPIAWSPASPAADAAFCRSAVLSPASWDRPGRSREWPRSVACRAGAAVRRRSVASRSQAPPASTPAAANTENLAHLMVSPSANVKSIRTVTQSKGCAIPGASRVLAFFFPGSDHVPRLSGFPVTGVKSPRRGPGPAAASARPVSLVETLT